jgi:hypothetical protein
MSTAAFLVVVLAILFRADVSALIRAAIARWLK